MPRYRPSKYSGCLLAFPRRPCALWRPAEIGRRTIEVGGRFLTVLIYESHYDHQRPSEPEPRWGFPHTVHARGCP